MLPGVDPEVPLPWRTPGNRWSKGLLSPPAMAIPGTVAVPSFVEGTAEENDRPPGRLLGQR